MDLVSAFSSLQTSKTMGEVQIRVAKKILDNSQLEGSSAVKLIEAATQGIAKASDALATQATGLGNLLDVTG
jgi:hypothetical protein